jgi:hypothetical protein
MGDEIDSGPVAVAFWYSAATLPWLCACSRERMPLVRGSRVDATA